jgi:hypothetical protein
LGPKERLTERFSERGLFIDPSFFAKNEKGLDLLHGDPVLLEWVDTLYKERSFVVWY